MSEAGIINRETSGGESVPPEFGRLSPVACAGPPARPRPLPDGTVRPGPRREALFALYAFNYEIARVREAVTQPMLGPNPAAMVAREHRCGLRRGARRHHIVVEPLTAVIRACALTRAHFERMIDAREGDLAEVPSASLAAMEDYAEATSATLVYLALEGLTVCEPAAHKAGFHVGIGYALAGLLRAMPFHARAGR